MTTVAAYVPDLMDRSKLSAAGSGNLTFARTPADLVAMAADLYVVDLARPGVFDVLPSLAGRHVIGFGSHVDTDLLRAAEAAGCEVLPRSKFFSRLPDLF